MKTALLLGLGALSLCSGFTTGPALTFRAPRPAGTCAGVRMAEAPLQTRREAGQALGLAALAVLLGRGAPASADMTLISIKKSYFRYVPRIERGRDLFVLRLRRDIEQGKWDGVLDLFEKKSRAQEDSTKKSLGLDAKVSRLESDLFTPMEVWGTSFAEKGTSPKQRKLQSKIDDLKAALDEVRVAAGGNGGKPDKEAAVAAWEKGRDAFNSYIKTANKGLTLQLRQLEKIPEDWRSYTESPERPSSYLEDRGKTILEE